MKRLALIVAVLLLAVPATAFASADDVIHDCADDFEMSRTYSQAEYKKALQTLPADVDEYTPCRSIIRQAQLKGAGGSGSGSGQAAGTGGGKSGRNERRGTKRRQHGGSSAATGRVGRSPIKPATLNSSASIPTPLIVVLLLTALGAAAAGAIAIRRIVLSRRNGQ